VVTSKHLQPQILQRPPIRSSGALIPSEVLQLNFGFDALMDYWILFPLWILELLTRQRMHHIPNVGICCLIFVCLIFQFNNSEVMQDLIFEYCDLNVETATIFFLLIFLQKFYPAFNTLRLILGLIL
jgi:hypothetical protein